MTKEIWISIVGYDEFKNFYQVSNLGRVRSVDRIDTISDGRVFHRKGVILKPKICRKGYYRVQLYHKTKGKHINIHRLVALAFIDNPNNLPQVNHVNGDKSNNSIWNLEWVTNDDNMKHAIENGLMNFHSKARVVRQYTLDGDFIREYKSVLDASRALNVPHSGISMCARGKYKNSHGFIWRYVDD